MVFHRTSEPPHAGGKTSSFWLGDSADAEVVIRITSACLIGRRTDSGAIPAFIAAITPAASQYSNVFHYHAETWADVAVIAWLIDAAAIVNQNMMAEGSYGPYARALKRICYEEAFHLTHGYDMCITLATGSKIQRDMLQNALDRWWKPIMMFHGPSDKVSTHTEVLMRWRIKLKTNDQQRQEFLKKYIPKMLNLGLKIPDPELRYDEAAKCWRYTEPDWDEFLKVVRGNGPASALRLATRKLAHAEGAWVRTALAAAASGRRVPVDVN